MNVQVIGLKELVAKLDSKLIVVPLKNFFTRSGVQVQAQARPKTPVDNGLLRNRLTYEVGPSDVRVGFLDAHDGTELFYQARAMEYGTGTAGDSEVSHKAGHFPPSGALDVWAARHGLPNGFVVAKAIARKGGLKARRMLRDGLKESMSAIRGFLSKMEQEVKALWDR